MKIKRLFAREILDSRGNPTIEVDLELDSGFGRAAIPSGASTGSKEALELRDGDKARFLGKGVLKAVSNVNEIVAKALVGNEFPSQDILDDFLIRLDGTKNKERLGANSILGVSLAYAKAVANAHNKPLFAMIDPGSKKSIPRPMMNIINGGAHADNALDVQEFMIIPVKYDNFKHALQMGTEVFHTLKTILHEAELSTGVGDEGGFAPQLRSTKEAIELILTAIEKAGYKAGEDISIALDVAASEFFDNGLYQMIGEKKSYNSHQIIEFYKELVDSYPIISIEDPISEFDHEGWQMITKTLGDKIQIVGDDVFVTSPDILKMGIEQKMANAILIKLNQIGTLTETLKTINLAHSNNFKTIISHRSGETEDTTISHLAVAANSGQIKTGSLCRTDRVCKYNELLRIEELL